MSRDQTLTYICTDHPLQARALATQERLGNWRHCVDPGRLRGLSDQVRVLVHWDALRHTKQAPHWREILDAMPQHWTEIHLT